MKTAKYFSEGEFKRCVPPCTIDDMDSVFLHVLDSVRETAGIPLILSCAYRTKAWELAHNRSGKGAHTLGKAADIRCYSDATRFRIIDAARKCGINRIGVYPTFIHLDIGKYSDGLAENVIWYGN